MLLFKEYHVPLILNGAKTQTRRLWPHGCRVKVGSIHQCRTRMLDKSSTFARVKILRVWQEKLRDTSEADARAEGFDCAIAYRSYCVINLRMTEESLVWAVEFVVVKGV